MKTLPLIALLLSSTASFGADILTVGSKAPPIKVAKWVKGKEVKNGKGNFRVVEFWATWCGPCKEAIPHVNDLAKKYAGKVDFAYISIREEQKDEKDTSYFKLVSDFVERMGDKMNFNIGIDGPEKTMLNTWMKPSGEPGIPSTFIVDPEGIVIWIGHPMAGLEETLEQALAGKYDMKAFAAKRQAARDAEKAEMEAFAGIEKLIKEGKKSEALQALDALVEKNPQYAPNAAGYRYKLLLETDEKLLDRWLRALAAQGTELGSMYTAALDILNDKSPRKTRDYPLAVLLMEKTVAGLSGDNAFLLSWLGEAYARTEAWEKAVDAIQRGIAAADKDAQTPAELKADLKKKLEAFKAKKLRLG